MLKPLLAIIFGLFAQGVFGQQPGYLLLIDAENHQPFQVMVGDSSLESSSLGHASIAHLKDSSYRIYIRFSDHTVPEQAFQVNINKKDQGYQLRHQPAGKWALYNWQSQEMKYALAGTDSSRIIELGTRRTDPFAKLMAAVVNDTSVMYNTYSRKTLEEDSLRIALQRRNADMAALPVAKKPAPVRTVKLTPAQQRAEKQKRDRLVKAMQADSLVAREIVNKQLLIDSLQQLVLQQHLSDSLRTDSMRIARERALAIPVKLTARQRSDSVHLAAQLRRARADSAKAANVAERKTADSLKTAMRHERQRMTDSTRAATAANAKQREDSLRAVGLLEKQYTDSVKADAQARTKRAADSVKLAKLSGKQAGIAVTPVTPTEPLYRHPDSVVAADKHELVQQQQKTAFKSSVRKLREVSLKISRKLVFLDYRAPGLPDTVTLFIYFDEKDTSAGKKDVTTKAAVGFCQVHAETEDVDNMRADILIANGEADKIAAASKIFKDICFSAEQLRVLTGLLVTDRGKYKLVEAGYKHIWDPEHLPALQDIFTDKQYVSKFHTLASGK